MSDPEEGHPDLALAAMSDGCAHHRWRVRIPATDDTVYVDVDLGTDLITVTLPDATRLTVNPTTARAVKDGLSAAIFDSLGAPGPWLFAERYDPTTAMWRRPAS